jgi:hypothetical protein
VLKKVLAHILLVVFIVQLFGMTVMYFSQRYAFKQSAIKVIESSNDQKFTILKLTSFEFQLAQFDEQELFINGQLFDIVEKKFENGNVTVKVYRDTKEESFLKKTINWFDASNTTQSSLPKLIFKTFFNPIVLAQSLNSYFLNTIIVKMNSHVLFCFLKVLIVPVPPPPLEY